MNEPRLNSEKEYEVLRKELLEAKKYVLARPMLIATISLALIKFRGNTTSQDDTILFQSIFIGLYLFNLLFTIDRMKDMAKKVSYIQLIHENKKSDWIGWETSLMRYRNWQEKYSKDLRNIVKNIKINGGKYDGYYSLIHGMHILFVALFLIASISEFFSKKPNNEINNIIVYISKFSNFSIFIIFITFITLIIFVVIAVKNRPSVINNKILESREIWKKALQIKINQ